MICSAELFSYSRSPSCNMRSQISIWVNLEVALTSLRRRTLLCVAVCTIINFRLTLMPEIDLSMQTNLVIF